MRNPTVSENSSRCGTSNGVTRRRALSCVGSLAVSDASRMLLKATSWLHGPLSVKNVRILGIANTLTFRAPRTSRPKCISPA